MSSTTPAAQYSGARRWFKQAGGIFTAIFEMTKLAWGAYRVGFIGIISLEVAQAAIPIVIAWVNKALFDTLAANISTHQTGGLFDLWRILLVQAGLSIVSQSVAPVATYLNTELGRRLTLDAQSKVYEKINTFAGLATFESPSFYDTLQHATRGAQLGPAQTLRVFTTLIRSGILIAGYTGVLLAFDPLLALLVQLAVIPQLYAQVKLGRQRMAITFGNTPKERLATYFSHILSGAEFAKEVRLFALGGHFLKVFRRIYNEIYDRQRRQQLREIRWLTYLAAFGSGVSATVFILVLAQAFDGRISVGSVVLFTSAIFGVQSALIGIVSVLTGMNESAVFYDRFTSLLTMPDSLDPAPDKRTDTPPLRQGIEFHNVSFRYSSDLPWVLCDVNLTIPAGRCVALVGLNGSGKTTLVKLLTRLYDPVEGHILWDGIDLRNLDPWELRSHMAVILEDFARYSISARENIGLGDTRLMNDMAQIRHAASVAGIGQLIEGLPHGYETVLSRWLAEGDSGVNLSGGEWQKIGLARMFMRSSDLLILDEPTAALDAQAELDVYDRFQQLRAGRAALLISHRFSTVRMADAIAVVKDGRIIEYGEHEELLASKGRYAELYHMQVDKYR